MVSKLYFCFLTFLVFSDSCSSILTFDFESKEYLNQGGNSFYGVKLSYPETAKRELDPDAFQNQFSLHLYDREHFSSDRAVKSLIYTDCLIQYI